MSGAGLSKKRSAAHHYLIPTDIISPTIERLTHDDVIEQIDQPIDTAGRVVRLYRAIDILAAMERRGAITAKMRENAETFRKKFNHAHLEALRASDPSRPPGRGCATEPRLSTEAARDHVWRAILAVGGITSPGGACLWHVVGLERTLKEWGLEQGWAGRSVTQEVASGILIASLGALNVHYNGRSA